jgi:hypothetical protein
MGMATLVGLDVESSWAALREGRGGVSPDGLDPERGAERGERALMVTCGIQMRSPRTLTAGEPQIGPACDVLGVIIGLDPDRRGGHGDGIVEPPWSFAPRSPRRDRLADPELLPAIPFRRFMRDAEAVTAIRLQESKKGGVSF